MDMKYKPTILIDLDGTLNTYDGNYVEGYILPVKDGAKDFLESIYNKYKLILFTSRDVILAKKWLLNNKLDKYFIDVTNIKVSSYLIIDDRSLCFNGNYSSLLENINNFKVWYKH
jgi:FMN phosphatase YigB (HAD superfamily)